MFKSKIVGLIALVAFAMAVLLVGNAVAGREATETVTGAWYSTSKIVAFGEDYIFAAYEGFSVWVGETGKEMLHGLSVHNVGEWRMEKGYYTETGGVVWTLINGDKIYLKYISTAKPGETPVKGTITAVGGNGKCAGIEGSGEYTVVPSASSLEGIWQGLVKMKFHYKLP
jgi:hypothetical protein